MEQVRFWSGVDECVAVHARPRSLDVPSPCVVLAHGFGCVRAMGLDRFAERFADAGFHALAFDYRGFGASGGEPRQLVSVRRQLEDWAAAIAFSRTLAGVDPSRIVLWGFSFGGGNAVEAAVRDQNIAAVVAMAPYLDANAGLRMAQKAIGSRAVLRLAAHGALDLTRAAIGSTPHFVPIFGPPGSTAIFTSADAAPGFRALVPPGFRNEVAARITLTISGHRPGLRTVRLHCPLLAQICERDTFVPNHAATVAVQRAAAHAELHSYPLEHMAICFGDALEKTADDQIDFLRRHLG